MKQKVIKIIVLSLVALLLAGGVAFLCLYLGKQPVVGKINFGQHYQLTFINDQVFPTLPTGAVDNASFYTESYFCINQDKKTGELVLKGLTEGPLDFIVTKYQETRKGTTVNLEFIYQNKLQQYTVTSTTGKITFNAVIAYPVYITQENPDQTNTIYHESPVLEFSSEVTQ